MNNISYETLYQKYVIENKTMSRVADEMGVAVGTVYNYIKKYNIPSRRIGDYPQTQKQKEWIKKLGSSGKGRRLDEATKKKISESHKLKGEGHIKKRTDGYIAIYYPSYPSSSKDGYVMEHILMMERFLGRPLTNEECVHHINEKRDDNRIENLKLMTKKEHMSYHSKKRWAEKKGVMAY